MSREALLRYRAERLLRKDFSGLRGRVRAAVRSRLRSHGLELDPHDLDACYSQAWHGLYACMLAGEQIEDVAAWLTVVTFRRAIDELRARGRQSRVLHAHAELAPGSAQADFAGGLDDRARLRHVLEALNGRLSARERQAASLCYLQGLTRSQAAKRMGISQRRMLKLMDGTPGKPGAAAKVNALLETIGAGRWCEQQGSLIRAYAYGVLDPEGERHALASAHLRECPACRAFVLSLRGLAAVLPPLPLPLAFSPAPVRAKSHGSPGATAAPLAKLAAVGVAALSLGGGLFVLAGGAHGWTSRTAPSRPASLRTSPSRTAPVRPVPVARGAAAQALRRHRNHHRPHRVAKRRRERHRPAAGQLQYPPSAPVAAVTAASPITRTAAEARAPLEEFGPERASPRRG